MSSTHPDIHCFPCDLRDEAAITSVFHTIAQTLGTPRVLINNGAVSHFRKPLPLLEAKEFDDVLETNLRGAFLCCREFVRLCRGTGYGRIINIASTRYQQNECGWEAYGASKGGLVSLTASLCVSLHGTGITVNAVSPGWIQVDDYDSLSPCDHSQHPSGRVGKPEDVWQCLPVPGRGGERLRQRRQSAGGRRHDQAHDLSRDRSPLDGIGGRASFFLTPLLI